MIDETGDTGQQDLCQVCGRRDPDRGAAHAGCLTRLTDQLQDLPRKTVAVTLQLVPGSVGLQNDRVKQSRTGSPPPARLDPLNMAGPGTAFGVSETARAGALTPAVRHWRTETSVTVVGVYGRPVQRTVVEWHQQPILDGDGLQVWVEANDQFGIVPPAEWVRGWATAWRAHFGHHSGPPAAARATSSSTPRLGPRGRLAAARTVLGLTDGHAGDPRGVDWRPDDPLEQEWAIRFGDPAPGRRMTGDVRYLLTWLDHIGDDGFELAAFATQLRALSAELTRTLGERPDDQWLGRCPTLLTPRGADGEEQVRRPCGAGLWQDPHAQQVRCPRCTATWGPNIKELLHLAAEIRRVWPVDVRRRYNRAEKEVTSRQVGARPACPRCGQPATLEWREVTAAGDRTRWWRPEQPCPCRTTGARANSSPGTDVRGAA